MIAEILPGSYDIAGKKVFRPDSRRHSGFQPTFPIGRYLSQPLKHPCKDFIELRRFLAHCKYVSDKDQFGKEDYWQAPELFEESKKGDCEDFALWSWRQLLQMNYAARFVVGRAGRYGDGHAWVTFEKDGKYYLLESLGWAFGLTLPRLSAVRYKPRFSVGWDGKNVSYFEHEDKKFAASAWKITFLCFEWLFFWMRFWLTLPLKFGKGIALKLFKSSS